METTVKTYKNQRERDSRVGSRQFLGHPALQTAVKEELMQIPQKLVVCAVVVVALTACGPAGTPDPQSIAQYAAATVAAMQTTAASEAPRVAEVTRVVPEKVTQVIEVTRIVPQTVVVTREVIVTAQPTEEPTETPTPTSSGPADAQSSVYVKGSASPPLQAGESGKISVIAMGPRSSNSDSLNIVVRNNTDKTVRRIAVSAVARTKDGKLFASGGDQGFHPNVVRPGEIALGYVYFGSDAKLSPDLSFEFEGTAEPADEDGYENIRDLEVVEASLVANKRVVGMLRNPYDEPVSGPIEAVVACFDAKGALLGYYSDYTDKDTAAPGATVPYQVGIRGSCPIFLVAGSGYAG